MCKTEERLRTEHSTLRVERDVAVQECDSTQHQIGFLRSELKVERRQKLGAEGISAGLTTDLAQARAMVEVLQQKVVDYENQCLTASFVCDDLGVPQPEGTSMLSARITLISACVCELERSALRAGVNRCFAIARSHYEENITLDVLSLGCAPGWGEDELADLEKDVEPLSRALADKIEDAILPWRGN